MLVRNQTKESRTSTRLSFPTIKILRKGGKSIKDYNGPREAAGIVTYVKKQSGPASAEIKSADVAGEVIGEKNVVAVGVFPKLSGEEYDSFIWHKIHGPTWHCIVGLNFG
ncbi:hypothetical protein Bca4012_064674 [Brassica carinata]|uniref:Dynein light chain n=1 Tax=Brassica carinata TaxID=52824 RepID=A0A8X7VMK5_BRACI|nr:hypothetical protein Bca52824_017173 [Brassica carinata]